MLGRDLLIAYRTKSELNQTEMAAKFGVTSAYVSMLLAGKRVVTQNDIAQRIEEATGGFVPASAWVHDVSKRPAPAKRKAPARGARRHKGRAA
jgi:transcriptional regulator with XRE-family HTH domain